MFFQNWYQRGGFLRGGCPAADKNYVETAVAPSQQLVCGSFDHSARAVTLNRAAYFFARGDPYAQRPAFAAQHIGNHIGRDKTRLASIGPREHIIPVDGCGHLSHLL